MDQMKRFAVYYAPRPGAFADATACWLGRDAAGLLLPQPDLPGLSRPVAQFTRDPARYGFHGTIRAPFRPADGLSPDRIAGHVAALARRLPPVQCTGLALENLHGFLALTPTGCKTALLALGAAVVESTNDLRAPLSSEDIARRRPESLTSRQRALLAQWGYPFVMEEFRFHLTLTDRLPQEDIAATADVLRAHFTAALPKPFAIQDLCLFGEAPDGLFRLLHRYALSG